MIFWEILNEHNKGKIKSFKCSQSKTCLPRKLNLNFQVYLISLTFVGLNALD